MAEHVTKAEAHESANHHWRDISLALRHREPADFGVPSDKKRICKVVSNFQFESSTLHLNLESRGLRVLQKRLIGNSHVHKLNYVQLMLGICCRRSSDKLRATKKANLVYSH